MYERCIGYCSVVTMKQLIKALNHSSIFRWLESAMTEQRCGGKSSPELSF